MGAFRFLTAGESHGPTLGATIEGVPAGLALTADALAVDSLDDHRLAMTFAIAGLTAAGRTTVLRPASASISYPGFFDVLGRVGS